MTPHLTNAPMENYPEKQLRPDIRREPEGGMPMGPCCLSQVPSKGPSCLTLTPRVWGQHQENRLGDQEGREVDSRAPEQRVLAPRRDVLGS